MIQSAPPIDISDLVTKSNRILDTATNVVDNVEQITTNLSSVSAKIDQGQGTMGALINDKTLYRQAAAGTTSFSDNMQALKRNFFLRGFFKSRGYENADELRKHAVRELPKTTQLHRFAYDASKLFDKADNAKLKNEKELNAGGKFLQTEKFGLAVVVASAGMKGDSEDALVLTQARAMVVRDYLVNHFAFNDTRLKTLGLGKSQDTGDTGKVELLVYPEAPK
jgi:hypothetical protein